MGTPPSARPRRASATAVSSSRSGSTGAAGPATSGFPDSLDGTTFSTLPGGDTIGQAMERPGEPMRRPTVLRAHGHDRVDDFYWMNDRRDPAVREFLIAENRYADGVIEEYSRLRRSWEESWRTSAPLVPSRPAFVTGGFVYEWQFAAGAAQLLRRPLGQKSWRSQMVVDTSVYGARGLGFNQGAVDISPDHRFAAVAFERVGSERFTIRIRDIDRNRDLGYAIEAVGPSLAWLDDTTLLYTRLDERGIPTEVWRHRVGDHGDQRGDVRLHHESDPTVFVAVATTASRAFAKIVSSAHS